MRKRQTVITLFFICSISHAALAAEPVTHWNRSDARAAVSSVNVAEAVFELSNILSSDEGGATLSHLRVMESRSEWPIPAREAAVYQFTRTLADLPRTAVPTNVMQHLLNYQSRALVPHQDHESSYVPLFNIRGAAAGVENGWQRNEYGLEAETLLATDPDAMVSAFVNSTSRNLRLAYLDALKRAGPVTVAAVQDIAIQQLDETPVLTQIVGTTAAMTLDTQAAQQLLTHGRGPGLSSALEKLNVLPLSEISALLKFAIHLAPVENATLAMAAWWPLLKHEAEMRDLMIEMLSDPELGSTAALVLAQSPDIQTLKTLLDTANGDSVAAQRARLALDISRDASGWEYRP
jgi:hypothetical protein